MEENSPKEIGSDASNSSPPGGSGAAFSPTGGSAGIAGTAGSTGGNGGAGNSGGDSSWMGYFSNVVSVSANYLPSQVTDTLLQGRAFATVHHNLYGFKNICALALIKKTLRLLLTSDNGYLYIYSFDTAEGGDCHMIRQFHLTTTTDGAGAPPARKTSESSNSGSAQEQQPEEAATPGGTASEDSEKFHEMALATETPPKQCFLLDDDGDFPPIGSRSESTD